MSETLGVGIIGASTQRGWARISHVPAVQGLSGLKLAAVSASGQATAEAAAQAFGAERGYGRAIDMIRDPAVQLVAVAVKVPAHRELVLEALSAGKHIYCEWPLGRDLAEAEELARAARKSGLHLAIGLQARRNPTLRRAQDVLEAGAIGRVLSARIESGTVAFGLQTDKADAYLNEPANGQTLLTIHAGHAIDAAGALLGPLADVQALATIQFPEVEVLGEVERIKRIIPDHVFTQSRMAQNRAVSIEVAGGRTQNATFRFSVIGETGMLVLHGAAPRGFQSGRLSLTLNGADQSIDEGELATLSDPALNVGATYASLRDDIQTGTFTVPDFDHAVRLTRLVGALEVSAQTGARIAANDWPDEA